VQPVNSSGHRIDGLPATLLLLYLQVLAPVVFLALRLLGGCAIAGPRRHFYIPAMPNDVLRLRNMRFFAYHGLFPAENELGQHYEVDLELHGDFHPAGRDDDIDAAINYPEVYALVSEIVTGEPCKLLEALAERIAEKVGTHCAPIELVVRVRKPNPPVAAHFDGIEVEMHRSYA
jgi:dihydroneopterin aldolase